MQPRRSGCDVRPSIWLNSALRCRQMRRYPKRVQQEGNTPLAVIPENNVPDEPSAARATTLPATDGGNAPVQESQSEVTPTDLESIRDELARRNEEGSDQP